MLSTFVHIWYIYLHFVCVFGQLHTPPHSSLLAFASVTVCFCFSTVCDDPHLRSACADWRLGWGDCVLTLCFCLHVCVTDLQVIGTRPRWHRCDMCVRSSCPPVCQPLLDDPHSTSSPPTPSSPLFPFSLLMFSPLCFPLFSLPLLHCHSPLFFYSPCLLDFIFSSHPPSTQGTFLW